MGKRIVERLADLQMSQSELARRVGVSQPSINNLIKRGAGGSSKLHKIAEVLRTTPAYLTYETDDPSEGFVPGPSINDVAKELGIVGIRELDMSLGMGATYLDVPVTETMRYFDKDWLRSYTRANPDNLIFAQGIGDSMEPTIRDSDLLLIDCSRKRIDVDDKIWAIAYSYCASVKRLHPRADGGIEMISDNPIMPERTRIAFDGELHVLGRVVAIVRKM